MQSKKALTLPSARSLRSNKLKDIQDFIAIAFTELDKQYRLMHDDIATIQVARDGFIYFGSKNTDGSWRIGRDGADWVLEHLESGTWVNATTQEAT